jgi:hypothetical protein
VVRLARLDEARLRLRLRRRKKPPLALGVAVGVDEDPAVVARAGDLEREPLVLLLVDERVGPGRPDDVPVEPVGALRGVLDDVEERLAVGRPGDGVDPLGPVREELPGRQVLDEKGVEAEAGGVDRVGEELRVVARREEAAPDE